MVGWKLLELPKIEDSRGNLTFVESERQIPFGIKRVYYLYDVPGGQVRGGHAHRQLQQVIIAASGSFDVSLDSGFTKMSFTLNRSYTGLYVPKMVWRELSNFSSGSCCLVLASDYYQEDDYFREYNDFLRAVEKPV